MTKLKYIPKYFPDLSKQQLNQFSNLIDLFEDWNSKVNLVSRKDIEHLEVKHVLHSLAIAKYISFKEGSKILDFGTGGGLPGIPLAIMFPEVQFHLVDSIGKKINIVKDIVAQLNLKNVTAEQIRVEDLTGQYDFIMGRAVKNIDEVLTWLKGKVSTKQNNNIKNGLLYLKGGEIDAVVKNPKQKSDVKFLSDWFEEDFFETKYLVYLLV